MWITFEEFKAFIAKGNVIDMAVAVVVGGAFGKIVTSLVNDIIMPLIGLITGGFNVKDAKWVIEAAIMDGETVVTPEVALTYGAFIQTIIDFLLIAFSIFIFLKVILAAKSKIIKKAEEPAPEAPAEEPKETTEDILAEIRDLLKEKNN